MTGQAVSDLVGVAGDALTAAAAAVRGGGWQVPQAGLLDLLREVAQLRGAVEAVFLGVVAEVDTRDGGVGSRTEGLVREVTAGSPGAARRDVAAARMVAVDGVLAGFGDRLAAGSVNREHVDVAVRCLDGVPAHLLVDPQDRATVTGALTTVVDAGSDAAQLRRAVRVLLDRLDPDGSQRFDPDAGQRRFLDLATDGTGMVVGRFQLDAAAGAVVRAAIDAYAGPDPETMDPDGRPVRDPRTARQRRADALGTVADMALGVSTPRRGERPRIVVHATTSQLIEATAGGTTTAAAASGATGCADPARVAAGQRVSPTAAVTESGQVVAPWLLGRFACDAVLQRVLVEPTQGPLEVGREHRLVTLAQRRALAVRDGGCVICGAPPDWCDAHHVTHWADGGPTDLDNLALLCPRHHTDVHTGSWGLHHDSQGRIELTPPRHHDPSRTPRPPVFHTISTTLHRLAFTHAPAT